MTFSSPEWFLLIPALLFAGWFWRGLRIFSPLRLGLVVLSAFTLADPSLTLRENSLDLHVLLDRSESTEDLVDKGLPEWQRLLEKAKPSRRDRLILHDYAAEIVEHGADGSSFTGSRKLTRTGLAISHVAALADEDRPTRILVFTDGYSTEPLQEAADLLDARDIPLDFRLIRDETLDDFRIARIELPERVQAGEPFLFAVTVRGSLDGEVPLVLRRAGRTLTETTVELVNGVGRAEFTDRIPRAGSFEYEAEVLPETDAHPGNNRATRWIEITGGPRVLLVTNYADDPLAEVLSSLEFSVDVATDSSALQPGRLSGARAVIFNNVPAHEVPQDFLDSLDFFVREQAGGFLMVGGKHSFGSGGYFQSSIDPLLPISMELKTEHRKLAVALAIVMDRSGSMAVNVGAGGGGKPLTKMDLANSGAAEAINLLGPMDRVCVFAVDSAPETVIPISQIGSNKEKMMARVRRIQSMGGGIFVYEGLKAAWDQLKTVNVGTRHVILFSDAADSEEPGDYKRLLAEMQKEGATVSVIGLGTKADVDAALLEEIAKLGGGRAFFSDRPMDIPKIFAQETVTIARSAFVEEPVGAQPTGRWAEISPRPLDWLPQAGGYNLSYARPDATTSLVTTDEYVAPLVAHARRGLGRTASVSFPLGGDFSAPAREWAGYGDFVQTLTRWLMGLDLPPGIGLRHQLDGTRLTLDLRYDPELWQDKLSLTPPRLRLLESGGGREPYEVPWRRIEPGRFAVARDLDEGAVVRGAIQIGPHALPFGPVAVGSNVEWAFGPERLAELRAVAGQTGGRELLDLSEAWLRPVFETEVPLRLWLFIAILALVLVDALVTRTGWQLPMMAMPKFHRQPRPAKPPKHAAPAAPAPPPVTAPKTPAPSTPSAEPSVRRSRYQRAKDRK